MAFTLDAPLAIRDTMVGVVVAEICHLAQTEAASRTTELFRTMGRRPEGNSAFQAAARQLADEVWTAVARPILYHVTNVLDQRDEAVLAVVKSRVKTYAAQSARAARDIATNQNRLQVLDPIGTPVPPEQRLAVQRLQRRLVALLDVPG